jgi:hypothetical protein
VNWLTTIITAVSALLGGGAVVAIVNALAGRKQRSVDAGGKLSDSALKWVEQFQEETAAARREAAEARTEAASANAAARREIDAMRQEAAAARREVAQVRDEAERALRSIRLLVLSPGATLEQIREHVTGPGWLNGH